MEVILLQDVSGIGKKNDVLVVGDGYALNYLLPQRKALVATPTVRKRYAEQIKRRAVEKEKERASRDATAATIQNKTLSFVRKASKGGKLYAGVTEKDVASELKGKFGVEVTPDDISMSEHIKTTGNTQVKVKVGGTAVAITVSIQPQEEKAEKKAAK